MASRILHLAVAQEIMKHVTINDQNRFRLGSILPDANNPVAPKADSHFKMSVCGNSKKTCDLDKYISLFQNKMNKDALYLGYYLHLIQDMIFRELMYDKYKWDPMIPGHVDLLHQDYQLTNLHAIKKYGIVDEMKLIEGLNSELIYSIYPFEAEAFVCDMANDFLETPVGETFFYTKEMADEFVQKATDACLKEIHALSKGERFMDVYKHAWSRKPICLLKTTQNTRDLGGYLTKTGALTKEKSILRSDAQLFPSEEDVDYLKRLGITTVIDMRGQKDVDEKPNGFSKKDSFSYFNFQINEGSQVPESVAAVSPSYMKIAAAKAMPDVFRCIAAASTGVMINCSAGKDRTGVVSAILLCHAGVRDQDIIDNYVLTKEYGKERLESIKQNYPEIDMNIVTPCERFMEEFLELFRAKYQDTDGYFKALGLRDEEIQAIRDKLSKI